MKLLALLTAAALLIASHAPAQVKNVTKTISTNGLVENLVVPSGKTLTINAGGSIVNNGTATGFTAAAAWGSITGTLSSQTDLQTALDAKLATSTAASTYQPLDSGLTALAGLADASGVLTNNGSGSLSYTATSTGGNTFGTDAGKIAVYSDSGEFTAASAIRLTSGPTVMGIWFGSHRLASSASGLTKTWTLPNTTGTLITTGDTIALSQLAQTSATSGQAIAWNGSAWAPTTITSGATLAGNTFTGIQQFSGTDHAGLRLNNLTTTQRDAIAAPAAGMVIWNTTAARIQAYNGSGWTAGMVRLDGDTMTGALNITAGTATSSTPPLNITQAWNNAAVTFRGLEFAATNTSSNASSTLIRLLGGASGTTQAFAVTASTGSATFGASSNSATITLQGSDRSAVASLGAFGNEFRLTNLQLGTTNPSLRFTDANAVIRYGTIYGETTDVLALRNGSGGTTGAAWELLEMTAPGTPSADRFRVYAEDNGSGKTRLVVKWADGTTTVLATQP